MPRSCDRRAFLTRLAGAGVVAPWLPLAACGGEDAGGPDGRAETPVAGTGAEARSASGALAPPRVVLRPWSASAVRVLSGVDELPMAYVSHGLRRVFVDRAFRDRASFLLRAHISVSTGLWRIPLPGDPPGEPVTPGDELREFEELDIVEWSPELEPTEGDFRLRTGRIEPGRVALECVPVPGAGRWVSGGPWSVLQRVPGSGTCREDFVEMGSGVRHDVRGCPGDGGAVRVMAWLGGVEG